MSRHVVAILIALSPAAATASEIESLAKSFLCTETVSVERVRGERTERIHVGDYEYLLRRPRRAKNLPYVFREQRFPRADSTVDRLPQPVPLTWLALAEFDPQAFEVSGGCDDDGTGCASFAGRLAFRDGRDPREWKGRFWLDDVGRVRRVEASPVNQGEPLEQLFQRDTVGFGTPSGAPGAELGSIRVDGAVELVRCEIDFAELIPGELLPLHSVCSRDDVRPGGTVLRRWSVHRTFGECKRFAVETEEEVAPIEPGDDPLDP